MLDKRIMYSELNSAVGELTQSDNQNSHTYSNPNIL